jgi:hypothetical protein
MVQVTKKVVPQAHRKDGGEGREGAWTNGWSSPAPLRLIDHLTCHIHAYPRRILTLRTSVLKMGAAVSSVGVRLGDCAVRQSEHTPL